MSAVRIVWQCGSPESLEEIEPEWLSAIPLLVGAHSITNSARVVATCYELPIEAVLAATGNGRARL
jgi:hypothetical protein